ncbi:hypothetical protein [Streptomyces sp. LN590]|uniref:hypothetical protein n=1 Tax=Streptomyces sp. LN590 TaxID=3112980 RepID=UPI00370FD9F1
MRAGSVRTPIIAGQQAPLLDCSSTGRESLGGSRLSAAAASSLPFGALQAADERFTEATAARPVIRPELIIYDQGSPYVSEHFTEVCDRLRIARRPARKRTAPDKPLVEHFFVTLAHRFSQYVRHGWQGRSHKKRGRGIERMPLYTIAELQQMAQEWVALEYQQTPDAGLRDPFRPGIMLSPNDMYAVQVARSGYRPMPLSPHPPRTASSCCRGGSSPARAAS